MYSWLQAYTNGITKRNYDSQALPVRRTKIFSRGIPFAMNKSANLWALASTFELLIFTIWRSLQVNDLPCSLIPVSNAFLLLVSKFFCRSTKLLLSLCSSINKRHQGWIYTYQFKLKKKPLYIRWMLQQENHCIEISSHTPFTKGQGLQVAKSWTPFQFPNQNHLHIAKRTQRT